MADNNAFGVSNPNQNKAIHAKKAQFVPHPMFPDRKMKVGSQEHQKMSAIQKKGKEDIKYGAGD